MARVRAMLQSLLLTGAILGATTANADVAQSPLLVSGDAPPNIMFVLDDSGSMHWEYIPDAVGNRYNRRPFVYPQPRGVYGAGDYTYPCDGTRRYFVPTFDDDNWHNVQLRSHTTNPQYYNPDITYRPWVDANGQPLADADPENALYNPADTEVGGKNLLEAQTDRAWWFEGDSATDTRWYNFDCDGAEHTYSPITYYVHTGGDTDDIDNFDRVQITGSTPESANFTSPNGTVRTRDEEIRNFANWFQYHRSRVNASRAGIGRAFAAQGGNIRVGFGSINTTGENVDGVAGNTVITGVRRFSGDDRENFFNSLYDHVMPTAGTPLRRALQGAGEYFSRDDQRGPMSTSPGDSDGRLLSCTRSSTVLMTDGFWNGPAPAGIGNADGTDGDLITGEDDQQFQYEAGAPFEDDFDDTLADVAMYYWKNDLQPDLPNNVPTTQRNPAFWQHMVTYGVGLGVEGSIDPDTAFGAISSGDTVDWTNPHTGGDAAKIDDLLHAAVNSRGGFFSAMDPDVFSDELASILSALVRETTGGSASIATNSTRLDTDTLIYQARYDTTDWSGQVLAFQLEEDGSVGDLVWDAGTELPAPGARNIFTWDDVSDTGRPFRWPALTPNQQDALDRDHNGTLDGQGALRLEWLEGQDIPGMRERTQTALGAVINSDPAIAGNQDFGFAELPGDEGLTYRDYVQEKANRPQVLYFGASDGMLHGVDAGAGPNGGRELMAYVPNAVYENLSLLTNPDYDHHFYVDGAPSVSDAWNADTEEWRTVVVGTTGAGGGGVFALDVTEPDEFSRHDVLWEFSDEDMHYSTSQPSVVRLADGRWVALFGNGYGEGAHLYVIELFSGELIEKITLLDEGVNGLATPAPVSLRGQNRRIANTVYAGDMQGNMWRIDLDNMRSEFGSGGGPNFTPDPLFTARGPGGEVQPVTSRPALTRHPDGDVMVLFGTGAFFRDGDTYVDQNPNNRDVQSFYGLRDTDNGAEITGPDREAMGLQRQEITHEGPLGDFDFDLRVTTDHEAGARGWYLDLISPAEGRQTERVVSRALVRGERVIFVTMIPDEDPCGFGGESWLMEMQAFSGSRLEVTPFDLVGDGNFNEDDFVEIPDPDGDGTIRVPVSGLRSEVGVIKTPGVVGAGDREHKYVSGSSGEIGELPDESTDSVGGRQSWQQLR